MGQYVIKRLLQMIPVVLGAITLVFLLMRVMPGDPVDSFAGQRVSEEVRQKIRHEWKLDRPLLVQYFDYLKGLPTFDFGHCFFHPQTVRERVFENFLRTMRLAGSAMVFAVFFGVAIGLIASVFKDTIVDRIVIIAALIGISTPVFWFGMIIIIVFGRLGWKALMGYEGIEYLILPAITLGTRSVAFLARMTRSAMLEVLNMDFLTTARAKGLSEPVVVLKHCFRNAIIPVVTVIGLDFASYLSGSVLTEKVFSYPGLGRAVVDSIFERDIPMIMGSVLFMTLIFIFMNLLVDVLYSFFDPRIRYEKAEV